MRHDLEKEPLELHMNTFRRNLQLATLDDLDGLFWPVAWQGLNILDFLHDVITFEDLAEDDMTTIEPTVNLGLTDELDNSKGIRLWQVTYEVTTVVMKNWEPLVSLPALAMERMPFLECLSLKFSSSNLSP